jgi:AraC family transcriptional regulator, regulatory protein of adaptative response / DNA-3-methyladenine glycosylase II
MGPMDPALARAAAPEAQDPLIHFLDYRAPYDWDALVGFLGARTIPGVETLSNGRYARTLKIGQAVGTVAVTPAPGKRLQLEARLSDPSALPVVVARIRRLFDLDADPSAIAARLGRSPDLAPLVAARPGLRVPGAWDGFELAVRAILGQQITVVAARGLAGRIAARYGEPLPEPWRAEGLTLIFPDPERLAAADLQSLVTPGARARALSALGASIAADPALLEPGGGLHEAVARLKALKGVGEWTAQYIALRALRQPDAFPTGDIGLMRALAGPDGLRPTPAELLARAEAWRPYRAYAALHLWAADSLKAQI